MWSMIRLRSSIVRSLSSLEGFGGRRDRFVDAGEDAEAAGEAATAAGRRGAAAQLGQHLLDDATNELFSGLHGRVSLWS